MRHFVPRLSAVGAAVALHAAAALWAAETYIGEGILASRLSRERRRMLGRGGTT